MRLTSEPTRDPTRALRDRQLPTGWACAALVVALGMVFAADRASGSAPMQHLYYLPIVFASIRFGHRGSISAAAAAILLYHLANPHVLTFRYEELDVLQMALFVAVGVTAASLANDKRRLRRLALTDDLSGLHNLRSFEARLRALVRRARQGSSLALFVLDVDRLKALNDEHGHLAGADAVRTVGHIIAEQLPAGAVACRFGGDEFVIALPLCSERQAWRFADELRQGVNVASPVLAGVAFAPGTLSISVGFACRWFPRSALRDPVADDIIGEQLFRAADAALYAAKASGRNRVSRAAGTSEATPAEVLGSIGARHPGASD